MGQRYVLLAESVSGGTVTVPTPANPNLAPPGYYMLFATDGDGVPSVSRIVRVGSPTQPTAVPGPSTAPSVLQLDQNYPNPFNPETKISYVLPRTSQVALKIYDLLGREITTLVNEKQAAGRKTIVWDARDSRGMEVSSGIYFYSLGAGSESVTRKMLLLK